MPANIPSGLLGPGLALACATSSLALPQTTTSNIFVITGEVQVLNIFGKVTTAIGAVANATKLTYVGTGLAATDLCATADLNAAALGTVFSVTGTLATGAVIVSPNTKGLALAQATSWNLTPGVIRVDCAGSDGGTGRIKWYIQYRAYDLSTPTNLTPLIPTGNITATG